MFIEISKRFRGKHVRHQSTNKINNPPCPRRNFPRREREVENEKKLLEVSPPDNKRVNVNVEYYVLEPLANSVSPSNKSKGAGFVSATKINF